MMDMTKLVKEAQHKVELGLSGLGQLKRFSAGNGPTRMGKIGKSQIWMTKKVVMQSMLDRDSNK